MAVNILDCTNLVCPMPIVKVNKAMKDLNPGDQLEVLATDPAFKADIESWTKLRKVKIISYTPGAVQKALLEK